MTKENMYGLLDCIAVTYSETRNVELVKKLFAIYGIKLEDLAQFEDDYCYQTLWDLLVEYTNEEDENKFDYHSLEKRTTIEDEEYMDYIDCMLEACVKVGLEDVVIYSNGREGYAGDMDIHVEAKLNNNDFYFYLRQNYGSCSYCDWLEGSGSDEVVEKYVNDLKEAIDSL